MVIPFQNGFTVLEDGAESSVGAGFFYRQSSLGKGAFHLEKAFFSIHCDNPIWRGCHKWILIMYMKASLKDFDSAVTMPQNSYIRIDSILFMDSPIYKCFGHCPTTRIEQRFKKALRLYTPTYPLK
ncbi:hypothetical protein HPB52_021780 [Rhipicephalus sanguineus]|uniref:Uncharacterized protein n=1 Tax=Rhipicephalus sanguineus TaxID=34632 RepID=A0A9D4QBR6_RHISA|nr:hypothetical protein HPB52_021780 [Rhipicephalus sanguineus]